MASRLNNRDFTIPKQPGFTIVELLVVVVIIAVLATITLVMYNNVSQEAVRASLRADLSNASTAIKAYGAENSNYPGSISDCPTPTGTNLCLKPSGSNVFSSYSANNSVTPKTFTLTASNGSNILIVTNNTNPVALSTAPLSPVADWLALSQGDHYGSYYDLASKQWATVTRAGQKTIYDPATNKIYDVPANKLGINPRSDGKGGSEAIIEEARTNYVINGDSSTDSNSDGLADTWLYGGAVTGTTQSDMISGGLRGGNAQRLRYTGIATDSSSWVSVATTTSDVGTFAPADNATASFYIKGGSSGLSSITVGVIARDSAGAILNTLYSGNIPITSNWQRATFTYPNLPASTSRVNLKVFFNGIDSGDWYDAQLSCVQIEKGSFATSYIPTTAAAITRNADIITVPTTNWSSSAGTIFGVVGASTSNPANQNRVFVWFGNAGNSLYSSRAASGGANYNELTAQSTIYSVNGAAASANYDTQALTWSMGSKMAIFMNGSNKVQSAGTQALDLLGMQNTAYIGNIGGGNRSMSGPIQRFTVYSSALSDTDVLTATNAIKDGLQ